VIRIDAHHHVWDLTVRDQPWTADLPTLRRAFTIDELLPQLTTAGIDGTVLVETINVAEETPELLQLAQSHQQVRGVVGWVELTDPAVTDVLAGLRQRPDGRWLVGIRHQVQSEPDLDWLLRPDVRRGLGAVGEAGLAYDLLVTREQLPAAIDAARALPQVRFILDHAGKPAIGDGELDPWRQHILELAALPNVAVKLSGLLTETGPDWTLAQLQPYADHLLAAFGPNRVLFGSDWPVSTLRANYGDIVRVTGQLLAGLSPTEQAAVLGAAALDWYRLEDS
jgi:L-fuconolactonase